MSRARLDSRHDSFAEISPEIGQIDQAALADLIRADPDAAAALLADMSVAVDDRLRNLARSLAARTFVRFSAELGPRPGSRRLVISDSATGGDLDLDRSLDNTGGLRPTSLEDLVTRVWGANRQQVVLLIDRSGSMSGGAVARAAVAAAALIHATAGRADCGVIAFGRDRLVLKRLGETMATTRVVDQLLLLRGHGTTDLAGALEEARSLLASAPHGAMRTVVLLSDCQATEGSDPAQALRGIDKLHIVVPTDDSVPMARLLSRPSGGKVEVAASLDEVARSISGLLA